MRMHCLLCGKAVPFWGETCPFCGSDKAAIQSVRLLAVAALLSLVLVGWMTRGWAGATLGLLAGVAFGVAIDVYGPQLARRLRR